MIQSDRTKRGFAQPLPHQRYPWDDRSTPILERYELDWQTTPGRDCHGNRGAGVQHLLRLYRDP